MFDELFKRISKKEEEEFEIVNEANIFDAKEDEFFMKLDSMEFKTKKEDKGSIIWYKTRRGTFWKVKF